MNIKNVRNRSNTVTGEKSLRKIVKTIQIMTINYLSIYQRILDHQLLMKVSVNSSLRQTKFPTYLTNGTVNEKEQIM